MKLQWTRAFSLRTAVNVIISTEKSERWEFRFIFFLDKWFVVFRFSRIETTQSSGFDVARACLRALAKREHKCLINWKKAQIINYNEVEAFPRFLRPSDLKPNDIIGKTSTEWWRQQRRRKMQWWNDALCTLCRSKRNCIRNDKLSNIFSSENINDTVTVIAGAHEITTMWQAAHRFALASLLLVTTETKTSRDFVAHRRLFFSSVFVAVFFSSSILFVNACVI